MEDLQSRVAYHTWHKNNGVRIGAKRRYRRSGV